MDWVLLEDMSQANSFIQEEVGFNAEVFTFAIYFCNAFLKNVLHMHADYYIDTLLL